MKNKNSLSPLLARGCVLAALAALTSSLALAAPVVKNTPFTTANITDLAGDVKVIASDTKAETVPKLQDAFNAPDKLETGRKSRVQLTAADGTIARVGSNTSFSLDKTSRTIHLDAGSVLFNSPKGIGGGTIETSSATATVLGTTIIVSATPDGGFKILVLEGTASIKLPNGQTVTLSAGQMTFVLPASKGGGTGPVLNFDLKKEVASSSLVNGFTVSLPSQDLIVDATNLQQQKINSGDLKETKQVVLGAVSPDSVVLVDSTTFDNVNNVNNPTTSGLVLGPTLDVALPPANTFTSPGLTLSAGSFGLPNGILPNNQYTVTGLIGTTVSASSYVNLAPIDGLNKVDILSQSTFAFTPSPPEGNNTNFVPATAPSIVTPDYAYNFTDFEGLASTLRLHLIANSGFTFAPLMDLSADFSPTEFPAPPELDTIHFQTALATVSETLEFFGSPFITEFELDSVQADLQMGNIYIENDTGSVNLKSIAGDVYLNGTGVSSGGEELFKSGYVPDAGLTEAKFGRPTGNITIQSTLGDVSLYDADIETDKGGTININALGNVSISAGFSGTYLQSELLQISAGGNLSFVNSTFSNNQINAMAGGVLTIDNPLQNEPASGLLLAGDTVNLSNISISGCTSVYLYSKYGEINTSGNVIAGDINILGNVTPHDYIIGVTADNPHVQAALTTATALTTNSTIPSGQLFQNVLFRPSDLGEAVGDNNFEIVNGLIGGAVSFTGNIDLTGISQDPSTLDVAGRSIAISGCTTFNVSSDYDTLRLLSSGAFTIAPGSQIGASFEDGGTLEFDAVGDLDFENVTMTHLMTDLNLNSAEGNLTFNGSAISLTCTYLSLSLATLGDGAAIVINNSTLTANKSDSGFSATADNISITSSTVSGMEDLELNVGNAGLAIESSNVSASCGNIDIFSYGNVSIANSTITTSTSSTSEPQLNVLAAHVVTVVNSTLTTSYASVNAADTITMDTVNVNAATGINMSARTINLSNINFAAGSQVSLNSANGMLAPNPNTSAASVVGDVNFIKNVTYNGTAAENFVPTAVGGKSSAGGDAPIQIGSFKR